MGATTEPLTVSRPHLPFSFVTYVWILLRPHFRKRFETRRHKFHSAPPAIHRCLFSRPKPPFDTHQRTQIDHFLGSWFQRRRGCTSARVLASIHVCRILQCALLPHLALLDPSSPSIDLDRRVHLNVHVHIHAQPPIPTWQRIRVAIPFDIDVVVPLFARPIDIGRVIFRSLGHHLPTGPWPPSLDNSLHKTNSTISRRRTAGTGRERTAQRVKNRRELSTKVVEVCWAIYAYVARDDVKMESQVSNRNLDDKQIKGRRKTKDSRKQSGTFHQRR